MIDRADAGDACARCATRSSRCSTRKPAKSAQFKTVLDNWRAFRAEQHRWFSIADARTEMSVYALTVSGTQ